MWGELRMAQSGLGMATAPATWVQRPGAHGGAVELVSKDPLKDAILSQSWTSFYIFPLTDYWGKNLPCLSFSSPPFHTSFSSSKMTSLISAALRTQSTFPQALACHTSTCLPTHVTICATFPRLGGWLLNHAFLSPSVQILPRSFPCWLASFPCFSFLENMLVRLDKAQHLSKQAI